MASSTVSGPQLLERQEKHCPAFERLHGVFNSKPFFKSRPFFTLPEAPTSKAVVTDSSPSQNLGHVNQSSTGELESSKQGMCFFSFMCLKEICSRFIHFS